MIYVVIPYVSVEAQGSELEFALDCWLKHFKEDFIIVVVGDWHPCIHKHLDKVQWLHVDRVTSCPEGEYLPHIDIANKLAAFVRRHPWAESFVYAADDVYAIRDFTLDDFRYPGCRLVGVPSVHPSARGWAWDLGKTHELLRALDAPERHFVTHAPVLFDTYGFIEILNEFHLTERSYVFEDLYFNLRHMVFLDLTHQEDLNKVIINYGLKAPTIDEIRADVAKWNPIWLNNGTQGWGKDLETFLRQHLGRL